MNESLIGSEGYEVGQWHWELWPMTYGKYRLVYTDGSQAADFYCMENVELGVKAHLQMVKEGVPPKDGWTRKCVDGQIYYPKHDFRHGETCVRCGATQPGECAPR